MGEELKILLNRIQTHKVYYVENIEIS